MVAGTARRKWLSLAAVTSMSLGLLGLGLDAPATAVVASSTFNAENGVLDTTGAGRTVTPVADEPSGSTDNSYAGNGPKEDDPCPSVDLDHAAPPKADLTNFWHGTDTASPGVLYLAWSRKSTTGTLTVDFELNQDPTACANGVNPTRTPDDLLVTYDFQGGSALTIEVREWEGTKWGPILALDPAWYDRSISADESFGELSIDLIASGILDSGDDAECVVYASGFAKTRTGSKTAFDTSTVKDFVLPARTSISNCGVLTIVKDARPDAADDFAFTATGSQLDDFTLDDDSDDALSNEAIFAAHPGTKTVSETPTQGWVLTDISCEGSGSDKAEIGTNVVAEISAAAFSDGDTQVEIDLAIGDDVTCTFVNTKPGSITISKDARPDNGRDFSFTSTGGQGSFTLDDDADGTLPSSIVFTDVSLRQEVFTFTEAGAAGWQLSGIDCGSKVAAVDLTTRTVGFSMGEGESVACTFVNDKTPPTIVVTKDATPTTVDEPGGNVAFAVSVTNGSPLPLTITDLSDSVFGDIADATNTALVSTTCASGIGTVLAAANTTDDTDRYSCSFTALVAGDAGTTHVNVVTGTGVDSDGVAAIDTDDATVTVRDVLPRIDITKTPSKTLIHAGDAVTYTYVVTNPGVEPLLVTMSDDKCAPVVFQGGDTALNVGLLDHSETWTYTCTPSPALTVTTTNIITTVGTDNEGNKATDTATATVTVIHPAIAIDKVPSVTSVNPGETMSYRYTVTNPGDVALSGVTVSDDKCSPVVFVGGDANNDAQLQTSETWTFSCTQLQTGAVNTLTNVGTARGTDVLGRVVTATDTVTIAVVAPAVIERPPVVAAAAPAAAPELPRTGAPVTGQLQLSAALLLLGGFLILITRRRREQTEQ